MNIIDLKNVKSDTFSEKIQYGLNFADDAITIRVKDIIKNVQTRGIKACIEYTKQFDNSSLNPENVVIDVKNIKTDFKPPKAFSKAIDAAVKNITAFHSKQKPLNFKIKNKDSFMGERWNPLDRVGCYVPGGTAPLISTVLMTVIPARIARVKEIIV
ncbi:MAG: histidinol dehydrogenase, partial [uncultured bacterium]